MNYIVFDLEATCWTDQEKLKNPNLKSEIIEIGAVKLNEKLEVVDTFEAFIQPILNKKLSQFCTELTTIQQSDVDKAKTFPIVIADFKRWIGEDYFLCSWGQYDKNQFTKDCEFHRLNTKWLSKHTSVKHQYMEINKTKKAGMAGVLRKYGLQMEGTHHRGIDDAKNIAKIFVKIFDQLEFKEV